MNTFNYTRIFTSNLFIYVLLPLIITTLGVFIKSVSQNDKYYKFKKEDLFIGFELCLIATISLVTHAVSVIGESVKNDSPLSEKMECFPWLLSFFIFGSWIVSTLVRKYGWKNQNQMTWFFGILTPLSFGIIILLISLMWIT